MTVRPLTLFLSLEENPLLPAPHRSLRPVGKELIFSLADGFTACYVCWDRKSVNAADKELKMGDRAAWGEIIATEAALSMHRLVKNQGSRATLIRPCTHFWRATRHHAASLKPRPAIHSRPDSSIRSSHIHTIMLYPEVVGGNRVDCSETVSPTTPFDLKTTCTEQEKPTG